MAELILIVDDEAGVGRRNAVKVEAVDARDRSGKLRRRLEPAIRQGQPPFILRNLQADARGQAQICRLEQILRRHRLVTEEYAVDLQAAAGTVGWQQQLHRERHGDVQRRRRR